MRNRNAMSRAEYVLGNVNGALLLLPFYLLLFFSPIPGLSRFVSVLILFTTLAVSLFLSLLLTHNRRRNGTSLFCNLLLSYGTYFLISNWQLNKTPLKVSGCIVAVTICCYWFLVILLFLSDRNRYRAAVSLKKVLSSCLLNGRTIIAYTLASIFLLAAISPLMDSPVWQSARHMPSSSLDTGSVPNETIAENMDTILLLREEEWALLDTEARLSVMKTVADIEASLLGIPRLNVCSNSLEEQTIGCYNDSSRTITLSSDYLASADAYTMLFSICHECYHAYQYRLVALYNQLDPGNQGLLLFRDAAQYRTEFSNYIQASDDYHAYDNQLCETDSDNYAKAAVAVYYNYIEPYDIPCSGGTIVP